MKNEATVVYILRMGVPNEYGPPTYSDVEFTDPEEARTVGEGLYNDEGSIASWAVYRKSMAVAYEKLHGEGDA